MFSEGTHENRSGTESLPLQAACVARSWAQPLNKALDTGSVLDHGGRAGF